LNSTPPTKERDWKLKIEPKNYRILNMKNFSIFTKFVLFSLLTNCATTPQETVSKRLFPDGLYTQSVRLSVKTKSGMQSIPMTSLTKLKNGKFEILGLTPFGTKALEANGEISKPESIQLKFHMKMPRFLNEKFIKETLTQIQTFQSLDRGQLDSRNGFDEFLENGVQLKIYKYTKKGIPASMTLNHPNWKAFIQTSKYRSL